MAFRWWPHVVTLTVSSIKKVKVGPRSAKTSCPPPPPPPQRVLRLNIPPKLHSYAYVVFVLVLPESFEHVELDLSLSSIGFEVVGYHLIISLTTNTSLNFYKKAWSTLNNLTGCLISMHLQYNSSRNREYRLILQFVIRGVEILCSNIHPRLKKFIKLTH